MLRHVLRLLWIPAFFSGAIVTAQPSPDYILEMTDGGNSPGNTVELEALLTIQSDGDEVAGWEFGVCHDGAALEIIDVAMGDTTAVVQAGAPPDFYVAQIFPGEGWTTGVVINLDIPFVYLGIGDDYQLNRVQYRVVGPPDTTTQVQFCDTVGDPVIETLIITPAGTSLVPEQEPGTVGLEFAQFKRGDIDGDGMFHGIVDGVYALRAQFIQGSPAPPCLDAGDANDDGSFSGLVDGIYCLNFQFTGGSPVPPLPGPFDCGVDPTNDTLGCETYSCP